jgi:hypothetical protein
MKLKPEHMLYVRSMGKALRVTAIFTNHDEANTYMDTHRDEGCVAVFGSLVLLANLYDQGINIPKEPSCPA